MDHKTRTAEAIRLRLEELGLTAAELARQSGVAYRTLTDALSGRTSIRDRRGAVERVLRWRAGSLHRAYKYGTEPEPLDAETTENVLQEIAVSRADLEALRDLADRLLQQYPLPEQSQDELRDRPA